MQEKVIKKIDVLLKKGIIFVPILIISALQLLRVFYEFPSMDECYYFTEPLRLAQGDKLFLDSWDSIQTLGIFLMPFYKLYISINGTKGIVLFGRVLYFVLSHMTAVLIFIVLRRDIDAKVAVLISWMIAIYAPFSLYTIGYNQLLYLFGVMGTMLFFIGISYYCKQSFLFCLFAGIIHSAMVASYVSSIAIMPILIILICLISYSHAKIHKIKWIKSIIGYLSGIALVGIILCMYIYFEVGLDNFVICIQQIILYSNNIHDIKISEILYTLALVIFNDLFAGSSMRILLAILGIVISCVSIARVFDHVFKMDSRMIYCFAIFFSIIWMLLCAWHAVRAFANTPSRDNLLTIDYVTYIAMLLPLLMLLPVKDEILKWKWFALLVCLSLLQAICVSMTSGGLWYQARHALIGTAIYVMVLMCVQIGYIFDYHRSKMLDKHIEFQFGNFLGISLSIVVLVTFLGFEYWDVYGRPNGNIFTRNSMKSQMGPTAGIYISEEQEDFNQHLVNGIKKYAKNGEGILSLEVFPYAYGVEKSMRMLTNNTWASTLYTRGSYTDNIYFSPVMGYFEHRKKIPYMIVYYGEPTFLSSPDPNYIMHQFILDNYYLAETYQRTDSIYTYTIFINKEEKND